MLLDTDVLLDKQIASVAKVLYTNFSWYASYDLI